MENVKVRSPWISFFALLFASFMILEAAAFQVPALPYIVKSFGISTAYAGAITVCYYAAGIVFAPIMGKVGDQIGRKNLMIFGLIIFAASELLAAFSPTFGIFLFARFIQGVGYACIFPSLLAFVRDLFPPDKRGLPTGILGATASLGAASGGVIAGLLIENLGWQSVYWVTSIFAIIGIVVVYLLIPSVAKARHKVRIDYLGSIILLIVIVSIVTLPIQFTVLSDNYSWLPIASITIAVIGLFALLYVEKNADAPIIDLDLLKKPVILISCITVVLLTFSQISLTYALTFFVAAIPGFTAVQVGLVATFNYLMGTISNPLIGYLNDKMRSQVLVSFGIFMLLISAALYSTIEVSTAMWVILMISSLISFSLGTAQTSFKMLIIQNVSQAKIGSGTGMFSMFRDFGVPLGSTFSLALFTASRTSSVENIVEERTSDLGIDASYQSEIVTAVNGESEISAELSLKLQEIGVNASAFLTEINNEGMSSAMTSVGLIIGSAIVVCFIMSLFLFRKPKKTEEEIATVSPEATIS